MTQQAAAPTNLNDLRVILAEEIMKLRSGQTNATNVAAIRNASGKIISSFKLEIEYLRLIGKKPEVNGLLGASGDGAQS